MDMIAVIPYILEHLQETLGYLPAGMACGGLFLAGYLLVERGRKDQPGRRSTGKEKGLVFLCAAYAAVVLIQAFFSREPGSRTGVDLELFATWGSSLEAHAYVIENIIMLIPFGILFPGLFPRLRRGWACVGTGCGLSILLEFAQWLTKRGHCQLDDVVMNTLGAGIGWLVFRLLNPTSV